MVTVKVWCLPKMTQAELEMLFHEIFEVLVVSGIITWVRTEKDELVLFPTDQLKMGLGQEILAEVTGLRETQWGSLREKIEREKLATNLGKVLKRRFPTANVACRVYPPDSQIAEWENK